MKREFLILFLVMLLCGCAAIKQGYQDYQTGSNTELSEGEKSPEQEAQGWAALFGPYAGTALTVLTPFFAWKRGRRIRKGLPVNENPATGFLGSKVGLEAIVQQVSNVTAGIFEFGGEQSGFKRAWKVAMSTILGLVGIAIAFPEAKDFFLSNPDIAFYISGLAALFGGIEKELSKVQPVSK